MAIKLRTSFWGVFVSVATLVLIVFISASIILALPNFTKADSISLHGRVFYDNSVGLPAHAVLSVQLLDVSHLAGGTKVIDEQIINFNNADPISFQIDTAADKLQKNNTYALQARITVGDTLWFVSDQPTKLVKDDRHPTYTLKLVAVDQKENSQGERKLSPVGQRWLVRDIGGSMNIADSRITLSIVPQTNSAADEMNKAFSVSGSAGCSTYASNVMIDSNDKTLHFDPPNLTFLACSKAVSEQENRFIKALIEARSYEFDDIGRLFIKDAQSRYILTLIPDMNE